MKIQYKQLFKASIWKLLFFMLLAQSCKIEGDDLTLNDLPQADFEAVEISPGRVRLTNKTNTPTIANWTIVSSGQKLQGDQVEAALIFAGDHAIKLDVVGQGGMAFVSKTVTVKENDPEACSSDRALGFIASCGQKKWKLNPEAGVFKVGPGPDNGDWWTSAASEVTSRSCEFNDEYVFSFNAEGTFVYDNKGDYYADGYLGNKTFGCEPSNNLTGNQAFWKSGTFKFAVTEGTGVKQLGQLRLVGKGAHIGFKKAQNGSESEAGPINDYVLYDILEMKKNVNGQGYDILKVGVKIAGDGWWTFTLKSFQ